MIPAALLAEAASWAGEQGSNCLVVIKDGVIVGEWYWNGWDANHTQIVYSVTKSITGALVGIAHQRGELDLDESASSSSRAGRQPTSAWASKSPSGPPLGEAVARAPRVNEAVASAAFNRVRLISVPLRWP